jgi:hypothetical protein
MIDERYDDNNNILLLNSLFTNKLLTFTPLFRGRVKDLHFQVIVPSPSLKVRV